MYKKYKYFVPLTSAKEKHKPLKNTGIYYILIYENLKRKDIIELTDVYKLIKESPDGNRDNDDVKKLYSLIDFYKAIPIPKGFYKRISIIGHRNQSLLQKEFNFCLSKKNKIISKTKQIITKQHMTHIINPCQCNYHKLEEKCIEFSYENMRIVLKDEYKSLEYIPIMKETNLVSLVEISDGCEFSKVEGFDKNSSDLQNVKIYAKDEFGQEKYIEIIVKIKDSNVSSTIENKELVGSGAISE